VGNDFGRNEPNIFWDDWGSGNRFAENNCDTSVPARLGASLPLGRLAMALVHKPSAVSQEN